MKKTLTEAEIIQLRARLQSRLDYIIAILLWILFFFSFFSIWAVSSLDPTHAGLTIAIQESPIFLFFPGFVTFGMISDCILINDLLKYSVEGTSTPLLANTRVSRLNREDYTRIFLIILILFISFPWLAARLGIFLQPYDSTFLVHFLFFQPVHLGEHHGFVGSYIILATILISKTEKLYINSIFKEISIYGLCFAWIWGLGLVLNDFFQEQLNIVVPFWIWSSSSEFYFLLFIQLGVISGVSGIIYYFGWRNYYRKNQNLIKI